MKIKVKRNTNLYSKEGKKITLEKGIEVNYKKEGSNHLVWVELDGEIYGISGTEVPVEKVNQYQLNETQILMDDIKLYPI